MAFATTITNRKQYPNENSSFSSYFSIPMLQVPNSIHHSLQRSKQVDEIETKDQSFASLSSQHTWKQHLISENYQNQIKLKKISVRHSQATQSQSQENKT